MKEVPQLKGAWRRGPPTSGGKTEEQQQQQPKENISLFDVVVLLRGMEARLVEMSSTMKEQGERLSANERQIEEMFNHLND